MIIKKDLHTEISKTNLNISQLGNSHETREDPFLFVAGRAFLAISVIIISMSKKLLIAEDDKEINKLLCDFLSSQGYEVIPVFDGLNALNEFRGNTFDMVLLDLMLPFKSGDSVLESIRSESNVPVIIVSAKDMVRTKVDLLRLGADDYITKPFDLDELLVRIEVVLRRNGGVAPTKPAVLTFKNLSVDTGSKAVTVNGNQLVLTAKEYGIIELLLSNPNKMFSKTNLFESVWHESYMGDDNLIKVHMSKVRTKIKEFDEDNEYIETVWGMGYRLKA